MMGPPALEPQDCRFRTVIKQRCPIAEISVNADLGEWKGVDPPDLGLGYWMGLRQIKFGDRRNSSLGIAKPSDLFSASRKRKSIRLKWNERLIGFKGNGKMRDFALIVVKH